jgi:hypothetical protein
MAKKFFYVCAGLFLLALSYHLGARSASAQIGGLQAGFGFPFACGVEGRTVHVMQRDGLGTFETYPDPLPGSSPAVGVWADDSGLSATHAYVVLANGDVYHGFYGQGWTLTGNLLSGAPTPAQAQTWGRVKSAYRK